ncbi:MAG: hypothetical protein ACE5G6_01470 [Terriglobia bacterium]
MEREKRIVVGLALSCDPGLLPVVEGLVSGLAGQLGFEESRQHNLQQGVIQACRRLMGAAGTYNGREVHLQFTGFPDRLEVVLEDEVQAAEESETESFLLQQLLDRVSVEQTGEGKLRLTLVMYR